MKKLTLLVAEDDKFSRLLYQKGLSEDLFEVRYAENGEEAFDIYQEWRPDVVLLDIYMPVMTGFEVLKKIREVEPMPKKGEQPKGGKQTVIIMATALGKKEDIVDCIKIGIHGYIVKPIKFQEIGNRVMDCYRKVYPAAE